MTAPLLSHPPISCRWTASRPLVSEPGGSSLLTRTYPPYGSSYAELRVLRSVPYLGLFTVGVPYVLASVVVAGASSHSMSLLKQVNALMVGAQQSS